MAKSQTQNYIHFALIALAVSTLAVSIIALVNTYQLKNALIPKTIDVKAFLDKLNSHAEMKNYNGTDPVNIVQITNSNYQNLQSEISGLNASYIGSFILQYKDRIIFYDYNMDRIIGNIDLGQASRVQVPQDFFTKLKKHSQFKEFENQQPAVGQLDAESLGILKQQSPEAYDKAKAGDYILRYETKLFIYDYKTDKIVNIVNLK